MKTKLNNQKGFTIIEVLIVLAIAGLILLIVFLAVPALQRNSRNTQRSDDVARALGAAQEVLNNNNGDLTKLDTASLRVAMGTPAFYDNSGFAGVSVQAPITPTNTSTVDTAFLYKNATCSGDHAIEGTTRQLAMNFRVEANVPRCQSS